MAKALKQIKEKEPLIDLFIVTLDGRVPLSSYNEEFDKIAPQKPRLFVITKSDLSDLNKLNKIITKFNNETDSVIICNLKKGSISKKIFIEINKLLQPKKEKDFKKGLIKPRLRAMVIGVPNSGKSTLINLLSNSRSTKVGNMPGVTKGQQWVNAGEVQLLDTPGILWPKFKDELTGVKLATIGSIKTSIIPQQELFNESYKLVSKYYPNKIDELNLTPAMDEKSIYSNLIQLANNKKFLLKGGKIDTKKTMTWYTNYVRDLKGVTYD